MEIIDPTKIYMVNGEVTKVSPAPFTIAAGATATLVAAISGYRIRVMAFFLQSTTGVQGGILFKSSGGTSLLTPIICPPSTAAPFLLPLTNSGYFETLTGEALQAMATTSDVYVNAFYTTYKP